MTNMSDAITKAGIAIPITERIWNHLKEHGEGTPNQVVAALKINHDSARSIMLRMSKGGMLHRKVENLPRGKVISYTALGAFYKLNFQYPTSVKAKRLKEYQAELDQLKAVAKEQRALLEKAPEPAKVWSPEATVNTLTFHETIRLYKYLKESLENV